MDNQAFQAPRCADHIPDTDELTLKTERRSLRKTSNELGLFILLYFLLMHWICSVAVNGVVESGIVTLENSLLLQFFIQMIGAVAAPLLAGLVYKIMSRQKISAYLPKSHVPLQTLVPLVMIGLAAAIIANNIAGLFDSNINLFRLKNSASQFTETKSIPEMVMYAVSVAIVPAFAEEFAFRGIVMGVLRKYGDAFAIIASSVMFGAMHGNTTQIVFAFVLGLIFAFADCKANSIVPSIIIHFFNNFYSVLLDIMRTNFNWDNAMLSVVRLGIMVSFCLLGIFSYLYFSNTDRHFFRVSNKDPNAFSSTDVLSLKPKMYIFFTSVGVIISLCLFLWKTVYYLLPLDIQQMIPNWMIL